MESFLGQKMVCAAEKHQVAGASVFVSKFGTVSNQLVLDTKDFGRVILGGGYAGISSPTNQPCRELVNLSGFRAS